MKKAIIGRTIVFKFDGLDNVVFESGNVASETADHATMHGFCQRIGDTAASFKTEAERRAQVAAIVDHYHSGGAWGMKAKAAAPNPAIVELAAKLGLTYGEALVKLANDALAKMAAAE